MPNGVIMPPTVAVVGGGISGLAAAHRVGELAPDWGVTLLEATSRLGGVIQSHRRDGFLIERGPDMFTTAEPWALNLCRRLGIEDELIGVNPEHRRAFVVHRGRLIPVPEGFTLMAPARVWPVIATPLLSVRGKLRLLKEFFTPPRKDAGDESLASFASRRLGREAYERLIQPLIGGIYTADPEKLSMAAALPQFVEMERKYGGVARALRRRGSEGAERGVSGARYNRFVTPRDGMDSLVDRIAARLPAGSVRLETRVESLSRDENGRWRLGIQCEGERRDETFDAVILAAPAFAAAALLGDVDAALAEQLEAIPYAGACVAVVAYGREQVGRPLDGFGCVAPAVENRNILSISFSSVKFPGRAPEGKVLLRVFVGGALQPHLIELPDDEIQRLVRKDLEELLGARGEPEFFEIVRWRRAMPQYHVGHLDRVKAIEERAAQLPGLALAGNAYRGVGIPFCIRSGEAAAERIVGGIAASLEARPVSEGTQQLPR
jgi:oxygen-dependent protoporphyrinogen oxidase